MSAITNSSRIAVLGASRGLGAAVVQNLLSRQSVVLGIARKPSAAKIEWCSADASQALGQATILKALKEFNPERIICALGGGPYGPFEKKSWDSHLWSFEVSLLFPSRLLHWALGSSVGQFVIVGSSVAESAPDPGAASYSASKHGLVGLVSTLKMEQPGTDVRLYSPGYMDTDMLPKNAVARQQGVWNPNEIAKDLLEWMESGPRFDHRRLAIRPPDR